MEIKFHEIKVNSIGKTKEEVKNEILDQVTKQLNDIYNDAPKKEKVNENEPAHIELKVNDINGAYQVKSSVCGTMDDVINMIAHSAAYTVADLEGFDLKDAALFGSFVGKLTIDRIIEKQKKGE